MTLGPDPVKEFRLSDLVDRIDERAPPSDAVVLSVSESLGIVRQDTRFQKRIALSDTERYKRVRYGDIVYNPFLLWNRAVGACFEPNGGCVSPAYEVLRPRQRGTERFLHYFLRSDAFQEAVNGIASGTVTRRRTAPVNDVLELEFPLPPLPQQVRVAHVLGALDTKVDYDLRLKALLERLAVNRFRRIFGAATGEMKLGDHVSVTRGKSYKSSELGPSNTALVTLKSVKAGGGYTPRGLKPFIGEYDHLQIVGPGEIVVAQTDLTQSGNVIGRPAIIPLRSPYRTLVASLDLAVVRPSGNSVGRLFVYHLLLSPEFAHYAYAHSNGSTVLHLAGGAIESFPFTFPELDTAREFEGFAEKLFDLIAALEVEAATVSGIRDVLAPKLIFGHIHVEPAGAQQGKSR